MYQFISLIWNSGNPTATAVAMQLVKTIRSTLPDYQNALAEDGCVVFHRPSATCPFRSYTLPQHAGVILGRVFPVISDDWSSAWSWSPSKSETAEMVLSSGKSLMRKVWGSYIAFLRNAKETKTFVIRDCSGRLPCYRLSHLEVDIFFADPSVLRVLGLLPDSLNWNYIYAFLCSCHLQIRDTAMQGVTELLAGDCFERISSEKHIYYSAWTPLDALERPLIHKFESAVQSVRDTTTYCVNAWSSTCNVILHYLSGGLDSSSVLTCLTRFRAPSTVICLNGYSDNAAEDERTYARLIASKLNVRLIEIPLFPDTQRIDESLTHMPLTAKPTISGTIGWLDISRLNSIIKKFDANSIWSGQGGDHLFMQTPIPFGPIDYAALRGIRPGLLTALQDAVHISKWNYWQVTRLLWKRDLSLPAAYFSGTISSRTHPFFTKEMCSRAILTDTLHPWIADTISLPMGQRYQIAALSQVLNRHRPLPGLNDAYEHHPLLSQPLVNLCLRIPSYLHHHGGIDRAVERAAFADLLPSDIFARRRKGQSQFSILEILHRSRRYVEGLLLDGVLVNERILDRRTLEPYLTGQRPNNDTTITPLLSAIAVESWIQSWRNSLRSTPRAGFAQRILF